MKEDFKILGVSANLHDVELEGICGKCCAECKLFYRQPSNDPELGRKISERLGVDAEQNELQCEGCTSLRRFVHVSECPICFCCKDRDINSCKECGQKDVCNMKKEISGMMNF